MTVTLVLNFLWATLGLIAGYSVAWLIVRPRPGSNVRALLGLGLLALIGFSAYLNWRNAQDTAINSDALRNEVECQRKFNANYRAALQAQLDASHAELLAQKDFLASFRQGDATPDARALAFDVYFTRVSAAEDLRNSHPLLVINSCGGTANGP
jgi:hypothetical protein